MYISMYMLISLPIGKSKCPSVYSFISVPSLLNLSFYLHICLSICLTIHISIYMLFSMIYFWLFCLSLSQATAALCSAFSTLKHVFLSLSHSLYWILSLSLFLRLLCSSPNGLLCLFRKCLILSLLLLVVITSPESVSIAASIMVSISSFSSSYICPCHCRLLSLSLSLFRLRSPT